MKERGFEGREEISFRSNEKDIRVVVNEGFIRRSKRERDY